MPKVKSSPNPGMETLRQMSQFLTKEEVEPLATTVAVNRQPRSCDFPSEELYSIAARIQKALSPKQIYLFGSFARGDARQHSDYDIYVIMPDGSGNQLELCQEAYCSLLGMKRKRGVDILLGEESAFQQRKNFATIERDVAREGILLYERS